MGSNASDQQQPCSSFPGGAGGMGTCGCVCVGVGVCVLVCVSVRACVCACVFMCCVVECLSVCGTCACARVHVWCWALNRTAVRCITVSVLFVCVLSFAVVVSPLLFTMCVCGVHVCVSCVVPAR